MSYSWLPGKVSFSCPAVPAGPVLSLDLCHWPYSLALGVTQGTLCPCVAAGACAEEPHRAGSTRGSWLPAGSTGCSQTHSAPALHTISELQQGRLSPSTDMGWFGVPAVWEGLASSQTRCVCEKRPLEGITPPAFVWQRETFNVPLPVVPRTSVTPAAGASLAAQSGPNGGTAQP